MSATIQQARLSCDQVLKIAKEDAETMYGDLSDLTITIRLHQDGWHIEFEPANPEDQGGGPHYVIDPIDGSITWKRYYQ